MNHSVVKTLVMKDWQFNFWPLLAYLVLGLIGLVMLSAESKALFYIGSVLLLSMVIIVSAHLVFTTIIGERQEQNLAFIMSLPVTFMQYTQAKIIANLGAFFTVWLILVLGTLTVIYSAAEIPNGLVVYSMILLLELFAVFALVMSVGLVTESNAITIVVVTVTNIALSMFMFWMSSIDAIGLHMNAAEPVWNTTAMSIVGLEVLFILLCLGATFYFQSRKRDFV
ncbi:hypothetical protein [Marinicella sp. W31]|uniref:hypothetical protein n=1 Tax=Marinicella sp. W31 TaxID=3023713 RepID=UPI003757FE3A